jgi:hypothetical protein
MYALKKPIAYIRVLRNKMSKINTQSDQAPYQRLVNSK